MKKSILLAHFILFFSFYTAYGQCLSGSYTIGGTSPSYVTLGSAVEALTLNGVCGPVTFNIRPGIYNEQVIIPEISGASSSNTIVFQSENGDSTSVNISYASSSSTANFTLKFNGADYITFKKLTLSATGNTYARVIEISNYSTHNQFLNNAITGISTTSTSLDYSLVYSAYATTSLDSNNTYTSNYLLNGSFGFYLCGHTAPVLEGGTVISGNTLLNQSSDGIYLLGHNAPVLIGNVISSNTVQVSVHGIICVGCSNGLKIIKNKISLLNASPSYGITIGSCVASASQYGIIANNFVSLSAVYRSVGISCSNSNYQKIYSNNVNVLGSSSGIAYYHNKCTNVFLKNNILAAEKGTAIYVDYFGSSFSDPQSDYNNLYSSGANIGYHNGSYKKDFVTWQKDLKYYWYDAHSISKKPAFNSTSDLHEHNITNFHSGVSLPEISDDIDNEARPALLSDIGADEVAPLKTDAGILAIKTAVSCTGSYPMIVSLYNFGSDTLKNVTINWKVNNIVQTPINWTGSLVDSADVNLGNFAFLRDSVYTLNVWTSLPNGQTDMNTSNDVAQKTIKTRMSGTYTIGGTSSDYPSFNAAVNELINYGVCDHVVFNVRPGIYTEQVFISNLPNPSYKTITFQSENRDSTSVNLQYAPINNSANYTLKFDYAGNIIFRNMTISTKGSNYGRVIDVKQSYINISNSRIIGLPVKSVSDTFALIFCGDNTSYYDGSGSYNIFDHNLLIDGSCGFYLRSERDDVSRGTSITNSVFQNQYCYGIFLRSQFGYLIENNLFTSNSTSSQKAAIRCENTGYYTHCDMLRIKRNKIIFTDATSGGYGIYLTNCDGNKVGTDLYFDIVSNNTISLKTSPGQVTVGIYAGDSDYLQVYNNSVNITGSNSSSAAMAVAGFYYATYVTNNMLANSAGGYALRGVGSTSDYNNLYSSGPYVASSSYATVMNIATLSQWQLVNYVDKHSKSLKPQFTSDTDLHEHYITRLNYGKPLPEITDDIDTEARDIKVPDIGADEYSAVALDASLESITTGDYICSGNKNITVRLINSGTSLLTSVRFNLKINAVLLNPYDWTGSLASGDSAIVTIGNYNFKQALYNSISIWTDQPNGQTDLNALNDTLNRTVRSSLSGIFTIGGTSPDYSTFNLAVDDLKKYGVCGPVLFNVRPGTYNEQISIPKIVGVSDVNTILFQSENGDSTSATLTYASTIDSLNFTVRLQSSEYITFKKLTITNTGSKFARVIELSNSGITVLNSVIVGVSSATTGNYELVYSLSSAYMSCLFDYSVFKNGSHGLYITTTNSSFRPVVTNNRFENQIYAGIYFNSAYNGVIERNSISSTTTMSQVYGIYLGGSNYTIRKNKIILPNTSGAYGIFVGVWSNACIISNNFIVVRSTNSNGYGLYLSGDANYSNAIKVYNNSVKVIGYNKDAAAYYQNNKTKNTILIKNNIFSNYTGGIPMSVYPYTGMVSDYNILYSTGNFDLKSWQTSSSQDSHSKSIAPHFISDTDLHEDYLTTFNLGTPLTEITDDIDGEARASLKPDIGADEDVIKSEDASVKTIKKIACEGNNTVYVTVFNYGSNTLTNLTVNWKINNVIQTPYTWTGSLVSSDSMIIPIGSSTFPSNVSYNFSAWTSNPNGIPDMDVTNDTAKLLNNQAPLTGTYTIGTGSPTFTSFSAAANYLGNYGVCGPVVFNVLPGTYTEQFVLAKIPGTSSINTVIFQSQNGDSTSVVLTFSSTTSATNYTVKLDGASYVTFQKMTMMATGANYAKVVELGDYSSNNKFLNNQFIGVTTTSTGDEFVLVYSENIIHTAIDSNNVFQFNLFKNGNQGINSVGSSSYTNSMYPRRGTVVSNNQFINQSYLGVFIHYQTNPKISENVFESTSQNYKAIFIANCTNPVTVTKNKINANDDGIILMSCYGGDGKAGVVANNFISIYSTGGSRGISIDGSFNQNIIYNTISIKGNNPGSCAYMQLSSGAILKNNILANNAKGYVIYNDMADGLTTDYNDLYTNGSTLIQWHISTPFPTLASWKTADRDFHSVSVNPNFLSSTDLHLYKDYALNNKGVPLAEIADDIDGNKRDLSTPDIGADEFDLTVDVNESITSSDIAIYPNPATSKITVEIPEDQTIVTLTIYNVNGQELIKQQIYDRKTMVDISNFSNGFYFVMLRTDTDVLAVKKIIKELP